MKKALIFHAALMLMLTACRPSKSTVSSEPTTEALPVDTLVYSPADRRLMDSVDALPGIVRTPSGLRYQIVTLADGDIPEEDDTVQVAYIGLHADGTPFWQADNEAFPLRGTIRGFREGVGMMTVGSTYKLYIPSALGYAHKGYPDLIQPNEPLIYEVTLKGAY